MNVVELSLLKKKKKKDDAKLFERIKKKKTYLYQM